jgi:hypothetical protein
MAKAVFVVIYWTHAYMQATDLSVYGKSANPVLGRLAHTFHPTDIEGGTISVDTRP